MQDRSTISMTATDFHSVPSSLPTSMELSQVTFVPPLGPAVAPPSVGKKTLRPPDEVDEGEHMPKRTTNLLDYCPECKEKKHKLTSACPFYTWHNQGNTRDEFGQGLLTRRRVGVTQESLMAVSRRVWPSVRDNHVK